MCFVRTEIEWLPGKNITQKVMKKKPKKGSKNAKPVTKTEQCDSFFNFFNPPQVPEDDDIDQETVTPLYLLSFMACWYEEHVLLHLQFTSAFVLDGPKLMRSYDDH